MTLLAITDHDAVEAIETARQAAPPGLQIIAGAEFTCHMAETEVHILGYGLDLTHAGLTDALARFALARVERAQKMVEKLNALGLDLEFQEVETISGAGTIARPHVASALVARGHVKSITEAFARYIGDRSPAHVAKPTLSPQDAFDLIKSAGGVPSLAHPGTLGRDHLIAPLVEAGLDALEVRHTEHTQAQTRHYDALARQYQLLRTGGSDFHGTPGHRSQVAQPEVPPEWGAALVARIEGRG